MSRGFSPQACCEHANEAPNKCPCPANCVCRTRMCWAEASGPVIFQKWISNDLLATARLISEDLASVDVYSIQKDVERSCAILDPEGHIMSDEEMCKKAAESPEWAPFLKEVASVLPAAVVMLT